MLDQITALIPLIPSMIESGKSVWNGLIKPLLKGLGHTVTKEEEKAIIEMETRKDVGGLIDLLKKVENRINQTKIEQNYSGDNGTQVGINNGIINIGKPVSQEKTHENKLSEDAFFLLKEIAEDISGTLTAIMMGMGYMVQTNKKNFGAERHDVRKIALLKGVIEELEQHDFIRANGPKREIFTITEKGYRFVGK
jgi:hypothetical protein